MSLVQRLDRGLEEQNIDFIDWEIQEPAQGMRHIWAEAGSDNAMPSRTVGGVEFLHKEVGFAIQEKKKTTSLRWW